MAFGSQLALSLQQLDDSVPDAFRSGLGLEAILDRYLLAVESAGETDLLASVLLLDETGRRLMHGAAPSLPRDYCAAIHGIGIGPAVGSCGTAAHVGHSIFVADIATDPLWKDFRGLALAHGLRACWSTPIRDREGGLIGTFAIYHRTPRAPMADEIQAIHHISGYVADAIVRWRESPACGEKKHRPAPTLT